jgi:hypothetical protein
MCGGKAPCILYLTLEWSASRSGFFTPEETVPGTYWLSSQAVCTQWRWVSREREIDGDRGERLRHFPRRLSHRPEDGSSTGL